MKILITGASGMLGTDLAGLLKAHFTTVGVGRSPVTRLPIPYVMRDLTIPKMAAEVVDREKPDLIFHAAAMTDVDECQSRRFQALQCNLESTRNMVEAANCAGAMLIFFSTDYVFNGRKAGEYDENDEPHPLSVYGESKYLAERYIRQRSQRYVIFRTSWLFGYYGKSFPRAILERAEKTKNLEVVADQVGRPTYTADLAAALTNLLVNDEKVFDKVNREIIHVANDGTTSWADYAAFLLKESHRDDVNVIPISAAQSKRLAPRPANSVLSLKKMHSVLGMHLRPWQDAVRDFLLDLKTKGMHPVG